MMRDFIETYEESAAFKKRNGESCKRRPLPGVGTLLSAEHGRIITLELGDSLLFHPAYAARVERVLALLIARFWRRFPLPRSPLTLFVALGNDQIAADALGYEALKRLHVSEHLYQAGFHAEGRLAALRCNVSGQTGIASFDVLKGVADRIRPDLIIAVDTLAAKNSARLGRAIQLSDMGITPGAGVGNAKTPVRTDTIGAPVLAIGVPLVVYARHLLAEAGANTLPAQLQDMVVTPKEIDLLVGAFGKVIATAVNRVCAANARPLALLLSPSDL